MSNCQPMSCSSGMPQSLKTTAPNRTQSCFSSSLRLSENGSTDHYCSVGLNTAPSLASFSLPMAKSYAFTLKIPSPCFLHVADTSSLNFCSSLLPAPHHPLLATSNILVQHPPSASVTQVALHWPWVKGKTPCCGPCGFDGPAHSAPCHPLFPLPQAPAPLSFLVLPTLCLLSPRGLHFASSALPSLN